MPGHLVTAINVLESTVLQTFFKVSSMWIAVSDSSSERSWRWTAGPENGLSTTLPWASGEPGGGTSENFGEYMSVNKLNDLSCTTPLADIIEYECSLGSSIDGCYGTSLHDCVCVEFCANAHGTCRCLTCSFLSSSVTGTCGPMLAPSPLLLPPLCCLTLQRRVWSPGHNSRCR